MVTGPFRIIGIFGVTFGIACMMMAGLSKIAGSSKRNQSTLTLGNLNANLNGDYTSEENMDEYKVRLIQQSYSVNKEKGKIVIYCMLVVATVRAIVVFVVML